MNLALNVPVLLIIMKLQANFNANLAIILGWNEEYIYIFLLVQLALMEIANLIALLVTMERDANYQEVNVFANLLWSMMEQMNNAFRLWVAIIAGN